MENHLYIVMSYITIYVKWSVIECSEFTCNQIDEPVGVIRVSCTIPAEEFSEILFPDTFPKNVQELELSTILTGVFEQMSTSLIVNRIDMFSRFEKLTNLSIISLSDLRAVDSLKSPEMKERLKNRLFDIPNLLHLKVNFVDGNRARNGWMLPTGLKTLSMNNTHYEEFDTTSCVNLQELYIRNGSLVNLPPFSYPLPPLKVLHLETNTLEKLTVNHLAELCKLKWLYLHMVGNPFGEICEIQRILLWAKDLEKSAFERGATFRGEVSSETYSLKNFTSNCTKYTFTEARTKRRLCLYRDSAILSGAQKVKYIFLSWIMINLILALGSCAYIYGFKKPLKLSGSPKSDAITTEKTDVTSIENKLESTTTPAVEVTKSFETTVKNRKSMIVVKSET